VCQASTPGQPALPGAAKELERVKERAASVRFTQLDEQNATPSAVLRAMGEHSWVHLACHASQNTSEPTTSGFYLHGGTLDLAAITKKSLPNATLAFLSACQTATGDEQLPEEAIHLAAGMNMAGYKTIIATMWSIGDDDAPLIADAVYERLLRNGATDNRRAARALHEAVGVLRGKVGEKAFSSWVPYIHIGQ
jgi:CHAT domain-containing protein